MASAFSIATAAAEEQSSSALGEVFQLHGIRGEGHRCQDLKDLSSALVLLVKQIDQQDGRRSLQSCAGTSQSCRAWWCCNFCGWNCRRALRGVEEESFLVAALPGQYTDQAITEETVVEEKPITAENHDLILVGQNNEDVGSSAQLHCSGGEQDCSAWWCCQVCGFGCDREAEEEEISSIVSWLEETAAEELPGCLTGATVTMNKRLTIDDTGGN